MFRQKTERLIRASSKDQIYSSGSSLHSDKDVTDNIDMNESSNKVDDNVQV